jgi:DNA helicase-2/ATP-dependent DNA helicase PcrA
VLGLTFTRKAAGQLLRRSRDRGGWLASAGLVPGGSDIADDPATVSTYHAFAGNLLREYSLLLPVEPDTRLLGETELWQLAFRVVCEHPEHLDTDRDPGGGDRDGAAARGAAGRTPRGHHTTARHHVELERLVHTPCLRVPTVTRGPSQWLLRMLATQTERTNWFR